MTGLGRTVFVVLMLALAPGRVLAGSPPASAPAQQAILAAIHKDMPGARALLEKAVNINSGTMNFVGVHKVWQVFAGPLQGLGFDVQWVDGSGFGRAGHLRASHGGRGLKILLIGHLDTVFAKDDGFQRFTPVGGGRVRGPGVSDMKGGDVIIITAMKALKQAGVLDDVQIRIIMTGDEEASGRPLSASKAALVQAARWADVALGFEDGDGDIRTAVVARRGSVDWRLRTHGQAAHSSQIFTARVGAGAVLEMARILNGFRQTLPGLHNLTFNPGKIAGGTRVEVTAAHNSASAFGKNNVVAQDAYASGGLRAESPEQLRQAQAMMQAIVAQHLPKTTATLSFGEGYPPMAATPGNRKLLSLYSAISTQLGYGPVLAVDPRRAGAADISFTAGYVKAALDGLGLMGTGGHTRKETAAMGTFEQNTQKAALLIYRLSQDGL